MAPVEAPSVPNYSTAAIGVGSVRGRVVARNALLNLAAETASIVFGLVSLPFIIRGLGTDSFGVLSLAWVLLGYFGMFDLGLSRATTKLVSEAIGRGETEEVPQVVGTTLALQIGLGLIAAVLVSLFVPYLATRVLRISVSLLPEAKESFYILAAAVPIVLASSSLRGTLEALQRFDLISYVRIPANALMFLGPLALLPFGVRLRGIVVMMAVVKVGAMLAYFVLCLRSISPVRNLFSFRRVLVRRLGTFGSWITVSNIAGPVLVYADRFVLGSLISLSAVAYYAAPADMVNRLLIIPASLSATLFPAFSALDAGGEKEKIRELFARAIKFALLVLGPCAMIIATFSPDVLRLWLGADFALKSAATLEVLALAVFINGLGFFPAALLQGVDRPDVTAFFHLLELPVYIGALWFFVAHFGILGAALACAIRVAIDSAFLFGACLRLQLTSLRSLAREVGMGSSIALLGSLAGALFMVSLSGGLGMRAGLAIILLALYLVASWRFGLEDRDRFFFAQTLKSVAVALASMGGAGSGSCAVGSAGENPR